jgi:TPP-dependent indolepyruvate ferredoxin oxidoreductase alpha subunit
MIDRTMFDTMMDINHMTTSAMVAEYNQLTGKCIKKFSTRAAGLRQLAVARAAHKQETRMESETKSKNAARSNAVAASWSDKDVKAARSARNGVLVDGKTEYKSVRAAFMALGLPIGSHIKFRMRLKAERTAEFDGYEFALI